MTIILIPQFTMIILAQQSSLMVQKDFNQVSAITFAVSIFLALSLPSLIIKMLVGNPLGKIKTFSNKIKDGFYNERLSVPKDSANQDDEDDFKSVMRNMNWMARKIALRETELKETIKELAESRSYINKQNEKLILVNKKLITMQQDLEKRSKDLEIAYQQMKKMAMTDPLTGIANRRKFFSELDKIIINKNDFEHNLSIVMIDIDHFKKVNDTYGHEIGDKVLAEVAEILKQNTRTDDVVARVGGEEYAIMFQDITSEQTIEIIKRIKSTIENNSFMIDKKNYLNVTISAGLCSLHHLPEKIDKIYEYADTALYYSKNNGRNIISIFNPVTGEVNIAKCA